MRRLAALFLLLISACAALGTGAIDAAGGGDHAWLVVEQAWREDGGRQLYHASEASALGSLTRVMELGERPLALVSEDARLVMIFPAQAAGENGSVRPVRSVNAGVIGPGGVHRYRPAGRARAEAALPGSGVLVGVAATPDGPAALLRETTDRGRGRLFVLGPSEWEERALPEGIDPAEAWELRQAAGVPLLTNESGAWVWDDSSGWRASAGVPEDAELVSAGGQLVAARWSEERGLVLSLVQVGREFDLAVIADAPEAHALVGLGETVTAYWFDDVEENRLRTAAVSVNTGEPVHEGFVGSPGPLRQQDLQFIALVAGSVLLIVILFVLRPEGDLQREPVLPEGTALAEPGTRFFAALVDVLPAAYASALVWEVPIWAAVSPGLAIEESAGLNPIFLTAAIYFLHSTLCEWLWGGRTIGKRVTGCRVVDSAGRERLSLRQAAVRNLFKAVFPPLTILLLLDPARRHPADQVAGTVVASRAVQEPPQDE